MTQQAVSGVRELKGSRRTLSLQSGMEVASDERKQ